MVRCAEGQVLLLAKDTADWPTSQGRPKSLGDGRVPASGLYTTECAGGVEKRWKGTFPARLGLLRWEANNGRMSTMCRLRSVTGYLLAVAFETVCLLAWIHLKKFRDFCLNYALLLTC